MHVFLFGAGLCPEVQTALELPLGQPATFDGHQAVMRNDGLGACLMPAEATVDGHTTDLPNDHPFFALMQVLDAKPKTVSLDRGSATAFGWADDGEAFHLDSWVDRWGKTTARVIKDLIALGKEHAVEQLQRSLPQIAVRASSWVRAQAETTTQNLRHGFTAADVAAEPSQYPYLDFFSLEEQNLTFRQFNGQHSNLVKRAAFVSGDAVTVLPYDPNRQRVMLVEQFRYAPFVRGDRSPWSLEPIAGRIDPGETPEQAARRESMEEAGLKIATLHPIGQYYPSPGAVSEYLFSYIAVTDLPDDIAGIGGMADEAEDIRGILLSFDELEALIRTPEAQNGPLILSALWLIQNRGSL